MSDLSRASQRVIARQEASAGDALLPFAGFDLDVSELQGFVNNNVGAAALAIASGKAWETCLRDLLCNGLLVGLMVGQVRDESQLSEGARQ